MSGGIFSWRDAGRRSISRALEGVFELAGAMIVIPMGLRGLQVGMPMLGMHCASPS